MADARHNMQLRSDAALRGMRSILLCTLKHVIVQEGEGPEAPAHEQHVLLVQRLLRDLQLPCKNVMCQLETCGPDRGGNSTPVL